MPNNIVHQFINEIPKDVRNVLEVIESCEFRALFVGGIVRDFLLNPQMGNDFDIELRLKSTDTDWESQFGVLRDRLFKEYTSRFEFCRFNVIKIRFDGFDVEIAVPRIESYDDSYNEYSHGDFTCDFRFDTTDEELFSRRDFTINSIAIDFSNECIVDPFGGSEALKKSVLAPCSESFRNDPVRLLRAVRFKLKYDLIFSTELEALLSKMNLAKLTAYHYFYEGFKVDFLEFNGELFECIQKHSIKIPQWLADLSPLGQKTDLLGLAPMNKQEAHFLFASIDSFDNHFLESFEATAGVKKGSGRRYRDYFKLLTKHKVDALEKWVKEEFSGQRQSSIIGFFVAAYGLLRNMRSIPDNYLLLLDKEVQYLHRYLCELLPVKLLGPAREYKSMEERLLVHFEELNKQKNADH